MALTPLPAPEPVAPTARSHADRKLDARLFGVVVLMITVMMIILMLGLAIEAQNYRTALSTVAGNNTLIFAYSRAFESALTRVSALFLSFLLVFTGVLFVLRTANIAYDLHLSGTTGEGKGFQAALAATSPGLVIATLGVALVAIVFLKASDSGTLDISEGLAPAGIQVSSSPDLGMTAPPPAEPAEGKKN